MPYMNKKCRQIDGYATHAYKEDSIKYLSSLCEGTGEQI